MNASRNLIFEFDSIEAALADIKVGRAVIVVDDENRENEGDLICAAQFATPSIINFMATEARGLVCLAMNGKQLEIVTYYYVLELKEYDKKYNGHIVIKR